MFRKELLEKVMEEKNFTAYKLWKTSKVAQSTISTILSGNNLNPSTRTIEKIASALEVPTSSLFDDDLEFVEKPFDIHHVKQSMGRVSRITESHLSNDEVLLLSKFKKLNNTGQKEAIKRIEELTMISKYTNDDLTPIAAHDRDGNFSDEDLKHDINIMDNDDFWRK